MEHKLWGDLEQTALDTYSDTCNSWTTLDPLHLVIFLSYQLLLETLRLLLPTKGSHLTLGFQHRRSVKPVLPIATAAP